MPLILGSRSAFVKELIGHASDVVDITLTDNGEAYTALITFHEGINAHDLTLITVSLTVSDVTSILREILKNSTGGPSPNLAVV
jgi:hypothetical protein